MSAARFAVLAPPPAARGPAGWVWPVLPLPRARLALAGARGWWLGCPGPARGAVRVALTAARALGARAALLAGPAAVAWGGPLPARAGGLWATGGDGLGTWAVLTSLWRSTGAPRPGEAECLVWGADGPAGALAARILAASVRHLTLFGEQAPRLAALARRVLADAGLTVAVSVDPVAALRRALLVVAAVGGPPTAQAVPSGAWVCDLTPQGAWARCLANRPDVTVVGGAAVAAPDGVAPPLPGLPGGALPASWAEAALLSLGALDVRGLYEPDRLAEAARAARLRAVGLLWAGGGTRPVFEEA